MPRKPRREAPASACAICYKPRTFNTKLGVYVCKRCQPHDASPDETADPTIVLFEGVEVDST